MKKLILLVAVIFLGVAVQAQTEKKVEVKKTTTVKEQKKNPIKPFYGKKLVVKTHTEGDTKVTHTRADASIFHADGKYEQNWNNKSETGTWTYVESSNTIVINCNGTKRYLVEKFTDTELHLKNVKEKLNFMLLQ